MKKRNIIYLIIPILMGGSFWGGYTTKKCPQTDWVEKQKEIFPREYVFKDSLPEGNLSRDYHFWLSTKGYASKGYMSREGLVPTPEIAVQIAKIILKNIYGAVNIENQKPYFVDLKDNIWTIEGTGDYQQGGNGYIEINKINGEILKVLHSK